METSDEQTQQPVDSIDAIMAKFSNELDYVDPRFTDLVTPRYYPGLMLRFPKNIQELKNGAGFLALQKSSLGSNAIGFAGRRATRILNAGKFTTHTWSLNHSTSGSYKRVPGVDPRLVKGTTRVIDSTGPKISNNHSFKLKQEGELVVAEGNLFDKATTEEFVVLEIIAPGVVDGKFFHHTKATPANNSGIHTRASGYMTSVSPISTVGGVLRAGAKYIYEGYSGKALSAMQYGVGTVLQSSYANTAVQCSFMTKWLFDSASRVSSCIFGVPTPRIDYINYDARAVGVELAAGAQYGEDRERVTCPPDNDSFVAYEVIPASGMLPNEAFISSIASNHRFAESVDPLTGKLVGILPVGLDLGTAAQQAAQAQYAIADSVVNDYKIPTYTDELPQEEKDAFEYSFPSTADISNGDETHMVNYNTHASRNALFRDLSDIESRVCSVAESAVRKGMFR